MDSYSDEEVAPVSILPNNSTVNFPKELFFHPLLKKRFLEVKQELENITNPGIAEASLQRFKKWM